MLTTVPSPIVCGSVSGTSSAPILGDAHYNPVSTVVANTWDFRVRHNEGNALKWVWYAGYGDISP